MGNKRNDGTCKICSYPVKKGKGLRCCGACRCWYHFKCLNYSKKKVKAIKCGVLKIECPCPDCCTVESCPPDPCAPPPCNDRPCCCKKKCYTPCEEPNVDDEDCVIEIVCKNPCEIMEETQCPNPCPRIKQCPSPPRPRYQCEESSEESSDEEPRYRNPCCPPRKICFPDVPPEPEWRGQCSTPKPKCPMPIPALSRVPSRESTQGCHERCSPPKPKPILTRQSSREHVRMACQEWRERCCDDPEPCQDWRRCQNTQPVDMQSRVPSCEEGSEQEWQDQRCPQMPQCEPSHQDWRERCCSKPKLKEPPAPPPPLPLKRTPCTEWRERCCPKQKPPEPKPLTRTPCQEWRERCCPKPNPQPPPPDPCQEWREHCCPKSNPPPPPPDPCQDWREHCCPKPNPPPPQPDPCQEWQERCCPKPNPPPPPPNPCQEWRNQCCPSQNDLPESIVIELNSEQPTAPNPECMNPCCAPKMVKNACKPDKEKNEENSCQLRSPPIEDVIRLVCKEVMDRGTVTACKKKSVQPVEKCLKCHKPKPLCKCSNYGDSVTEDDTVEKGEQENDTNCDDTDTLETYTKACDILLQDSDGAETLSLNAVEKMCKTVGKLALQMNDLMEKLRKSVTHTKESVADVAKKDSSPPVKKRGVKINCPNKRTAD